MERMVKKIRRWMKHRERNVSIPLGIFLVLLLSYVYVFPRWADPNQNSRIDMIVAVVEDGTFQIDDYVQNTVDYALYDGHYYSDKAPGASLLGIPIYAILRQVLNIPAIEGIIVRVANTEAFTSTLKEGGTGLLVDKLHFFIAQITLSIFTAAIPTAIIGLLIYKSLKGFVSRPTTRIVCALSYGLLTPAFAYGTAFYGHQLSAALSFMAFYLVLKSEESIETIRLLAVGFLLGYSVITEYPTILMTMVLCLYTLVKLRDRKRIFWVILAGIVVATGWFAYNTAVFGSPFELGYSHSELWQEQHQTGFMSLTWPRWKALWGITFSSFRGLFFLSPWLLLSIPGYYLWYAKKVYRREFWVSLISALVMIIFNSSSIMWWGGFSIGPRYLLPMIPFLVLPIVFVFDAARDHLWLYFIIGVLLTVSLVSTWGLTLAGQSFPPDTIRYPFRDYIIPNWQRGNIARNLGMILHLQGPLSLVPVISFLLVAIGWIGIRGRKLSGINSV